MTVALHTFTLLRIALSLIKPCSASLVVLYYSVDSSAQQPDHCDINLSDYMAPFRSSDYIGIAESLLPKFPVITSEVVDEILLHLPVQCLLTLSAGSRALHRRATCDDVWQRLVEGQWPGGRMLCKHYILRHSFLNAFRRHKALLSVDPAIHRGPLPDALAVFMPDVKQEEFLVIVELRYDALVLFMPEAAPCVTSPPLSIASRPSQIHIGVECLTSTLEPGQKIRLPFEGSFNPDYLSFAVTIVRKRDAKCKRIFQFPSPLESFCRFAMRSRTGALLFDCPTASEVAHLAVDPHMAGVHYLTRSACGLQVHLGIASSTDAYEAECVEIYSFGDDGELLADGIRETLLWIQHIGIWF